MKKMATYPFTADDMARLYKMKIFFEKEELVAYEDSKGILTVGIGHNCEARPVPGVTKVGDRISKELCQKLFKEDSDRAIAQVQKALPWVLQMNPARQAVIYDMCFNMGLGNSKSGLLSFNRPGGTLRDVEKGNYIGAVVRFKKSGWAKDVGPRRYEPLMRQLETGQWQF